MSSWRSSILLFIASSKLILMDVKLVWAVCSVSSVSVGQSCVGHFWLGPEDMMSVMKK